MDTSQQKIFNDCTSINNVNPLYLIVGEVDGYIEEKNGNKYSIFASTDKNKEVLKKYTELWNRIKNSIKAIDDNPGEYGRDFMKIRFESDDNLALKKTLKLHNLTVIVRSIFEENGKYYPQGCLYEL